MNLKPLAPRNVYVLARTPGADAATTKEWTEICRQPGFITVDHQPHREVSRWKHVERKRPFMVTSYSRGRVGLAAHVVGSATTLERALEIAAEWQSQVTYF